MGFCCICVFIDKYFLGLSRDLIVSYTSVPGVCALAATTIPIGSARNLNVQDRGGVVFL